MTLRVRQQATLGLVRRDRALRVWFSGERGRAPPWAFEHLADQGTELIEVDRVSQQINSGDQRSLADHYGRLCRQ